VRLVAETFPREAQANASTNFFTTFPYNVGKFSSPIFNFSPSSLISDAFEGRYGISIFIALPKSNRLQFRVLLTSTSCLTMQHSKGVKRSVDLRSRGNSIQQRSFSCEDRQERFKTNTRETNTRDRCDLQCSPVIANSLLISHHPRRWLGRKWPLIFARFFE